MYALANAVAPPLLPSYKMIHVKKKQQFSQNAVKSNCNSRKTEVSTIEISHRLNLTMAC